MQVGFFFWPYTPELVRRMAEAAERYGYDMIGIADTPGNAMDPWVATTMVAEATSRVRIALCVTNLASRHPAVSAAAISSIDLIAPGRCVLGLGAGHSGTKNLGIASTRTADLEGGVRLVKELLSGRPAGAAHVPWAPGRAKVFLAGSGPKALAAAGRSADGAFVNFGIAAENLAQSEGAVAASAAAAGRASGEVETWQIAALDCNEDGAAARQKVGAILAFMAAGYILQSDDLARRGVPAELHGAIRELRRRYSTRPGDADAALVAELGLTDYLSRRFAVCGTPAECLAQLERARAAGLERAMFTVSVASDPAGTVELFGRDVLPALR
jgi:alkanesulfonate monooxygenase SsuD/methylene tetrahydromethanopterin reductase-like flavin-dependent oxidoreductase (luciferase family)